MSTTFGIKIPQIDEPIEVLQRSGGPDAKLIFRVLNPLIYIADINTILIALDNTNQGIDKVKDFMDQTINPNAVIIPYS